MQEMKESFSKELGVLKKNQVEIVEIKNAIESHTMRHDQSEDIISGLENQKDIADHLLIDTLKLPRNHRS